MFVAKNKTQLRKHKVVHCIHPKTRSHNGYLPATESRETTQKLRFGPKEVDWASSLRKNKTQLRKHKVVHFMQPKTRSHNLYLPATESRETTQKHSFGPKEVDWACSLRKNKTQLWKHKVVHCMHPKTRSHNLYLPATESRETTQKLNFGPKEVDSACSLRKNKSKLRKHKVVHFMHHKTQSHNGYLPATESRETTQKLSFGPKEVDSACSLRKNKTQLRMHKVVHCMHPKTQSHNLYLPATESRETSQKLSFVTKEVDSACLLRKNKSKLRKHKVVHFMHHKTQSHNGYLPATESRETTQKLSFGPKQVDWACSLRKNKTQLRKHKVVHFMHPKTRSHNLYLPATESRETTQKLSFGPKQVDWACSLRKNKTQLRKHKVVHCMHPKTRSHNGYLPATESGETTQKLSLGSKEVDWASSLRKTRRNFGST